jgi:hypothetical protein
MKTLLEMHEIFNAAENIHTCCCFFDDGADSLHFRMCKSMIYRICTLFFCGRDWSGNPGAPRGRGGRSGVSPCPSPGNAGRSVGAQSPVRAIARSRPEKKTKRLIYCSESWWSKDCNSFFRSQLRTLSWEKAGTDFRFPP